MCTFIAYYCMLQMFVVECQMFCRKIYPNLYNTIRIYISPSTPVVCDPPCENGGCVENDTCKCSEGYTGATCRTQGMVLCQ